jgi:hypothetical protein
MRGAMTAAQLEARLCELFGAAYAEAAELGEIFMIDHDVPEDVREGAREVCVRELRAWLERGCVELH